MVIMAICNQKGGVGKTTVTFNLAHVLANRIKTNVLAIDNDPQGNLTSSFLSEPLAETGRTLDAYKGTPLSPVRIKPRLYLLGTDISLAPVGEREFQTVFRLKESLQELRQRHNPRFDHILIDCLPSFGNLHLAALTAAEYVMIPVKPAPYALAGLKDLFVTIDKVRQYFNPRLTVLGVIVNQVDGRQLVLEREMEAALRENYGGLVFRQRISKRIKIEESPAFQKPIAEYTPGEPAAKEFKALAREVLRRLRRMQTAPAFTKRENTEKRK